MARRFAKGELSARELCRWAHRVIGHDGDTDCQVFVVLDDTHGPAVHYDPERGVVEYDDDADDADLERSTAEAVQVFLGSRRS